MNGNGDLRQKIDDARRRRLPMPELMAKLGLAEHAKKSARCPLPGHDDRHPSFSVFKGKDGFWFWKCHAGCGEGDEILFLSKLKGLSLTDAISLYLDMADFPSSRPPKSHEYPEPRECPASRKSPECPEFHEYPVFPVSPVCPMSNGQELEQALKASAARNACDERRSVKDGLWGLARDLKAVQKKFGPKVTNREMVLAFDEWHRLSEKFPDAQVPREDCLAAFLAKIGKVRFATGEGNTLNKALEAVSKLSPSELLVIPSVPDAPETLRRIAALHRELSRLCGGKTYFLTCRDAAKAVAGLRYQTAYNINLALAQFGVVEIVRAGDPRPGGKASTYWYLLSETESAEDDDEIPF